VSDIAKQRTVDALASVWASVGELLRSLDPAAWKTATVLDGWDVAANVAHMVGTEQMLLGADNPVVDIDRDASPHVRNDIGAFNEAWVIELSTRPPAELLALFTDVTVRRLAALDAMSHAEWNTETFTPAGRDTYGRFMQIRVFDCWFHEQDVREALGRPGHDEGPAVEVTLDEVETALGFVVGKQAGAPAGSLVSFVLTGPSGRTIHVEVGERARVVAEPSADPTVTITVPVVPFTRLCGGRTTMVDLDRAAGGAPAVVTGDQALGRSILEHLAYTV
jgi:uncharacterized protein (TIGR03083 family)